MEILIALIITYALVALGKAQDKWNWESKHRLKESDKKFVTLDGSYTRNGVRYTKHNIAHWAYRGKDPILNEDGYTDDGYDYYGYDREGYNREGYDNDGFNKDGYDREGYNREGYDHDGYNRKGYNMQGLKREYSAN